MIVREKYDYIGAKMTNLGKNKTIFGIKIDISRKNDNTQPLF